MSIRKKDTEEKEEIKRKQGNLMNEEEDLDFDDAEELEAFLSKSISTVTEDEFEEIEMGTENILEESISKKKKWSIRKKVLVTLGTTIGALTLFFVVAVSVLLFVVNRDESSPMAKTDLTPEELAAQATLPPRTEEQVKLDEQVINILLIGEEAIGSGNANGRSDSMMIASLNTENKTLRLVSIMRDCYVSIPGYRDNKLNAAFAHGGGTLLCSTIEQNFGIQLDGYVRVDFAGFRKLIDKLGGVEIELTENEALYLNTTNYISDKKQRNVVPGKQIVTGTQALGYCRVRKRAAINGENDDFGRTYRQRAVLSQVYEKVKQLGASDVVGLISELLPYVSTNLESADIVKYATAILQMGIPEIEQKRIPVNGAYSGQNLYCGASLVLNFEVNNRELWDFIYGDGVGDIITIHPQSASVSTTVTDSPAERTYAPVVTRKPQVINTKQPVLPENTQNIVTEAPTTKPVIPVETEKPVVTVEPVRTERPVATERPEIPVETKAPVVTKAPEPTPAPVVTERPEEPVKEDDGTIG